MTSPRWLTDEERAMWVTFSAVLELLPAALDSQLTQDAGLTHFDYFALAMLSEAPDRVLRASALAARTNATLPRLSKVISRLEERGLVRRYPCPEDRRATNVALTDEGWRKVVATAPGHVENVRRTVLDALTPEQRDRLTEISAALLTGLDPTGKMLASVPRGG
ncbi:MULTISPECIES: MarR family transcriptional regulator [unclassified Rathayibacter]|uniref:MarR family winged helix-turn-helix transcriptional regulator n=1 Tax=unclassified Rathayibacter TaxID=2609250 RepID=UPI00104D7770|nr:MULTISPECIES: MarR family transcriptional regulator [unclassified Rathayibacter]TCL79438.1 DNA-binding MarR family transcriptional regulator [Rathayibacter sp. PhB192]TCM25293.1 DNA-binding MarR family transcriptional regulator [Rathayibacter sp. PhB179]